MRHSDAVDLLDRRRCGGEAPLLLDRPRPERQLLDASVGPAGRHELRPRRLPPDLDPAIAIRADVSDSTAADRLVAETVERFGRIDLLVNNAAVFDERSFLDIDDELWATTLDVNLSGPFYVSRAAARIMSEAKRGRIINICGTAGVSPVGNYTPYCASKAGLDMLTQCMAQALAPDIKVNGVAPGTVLFPEGTPEEERRRVISKIPGGAIGEPQDIADAVLFLADAPDYVTGSIITVDGGAGLGST